MLGCDLVHAPFPARTGVSAPLALLRAFLDGYCQDFIELHGDRRCGDDRAVLGGFGRVHDQSVLLLGYHADGSVADDPTVVPSFPSPSGGRKVTRLIRLAEKFGRPILTFYEPPAEPDRTGIVSWTQAEGFARTLLLLATVRVSIVSVVIGPVGTESLLAFGVPDCMILVPPRGETTSPHPFHVDEVIPLYSSGSLELAPVVRHLASTVGSALDRFRKMPSEQLLQLREERLRQLPAGPASGLCLVDRPAATYAMGEGETGRERC